MSLPAFSQLWNAYPHGSASAVKSKIGGNVNAPYITNTCVVRVSHCFNSTAQPIPRSFSGLLTVRGGNGKRYALRVKEFNRFMRARYGAPAVTGGRTAMSGKQGIIMFDVQGWSDATGHFDLWDGSQPAHAEYFDKASGVYLWPC